MWLWFFRICDCVLENLLILIACGLNFHILSTPTHTPLGSQHLLVSVATISQQPYLSNHISVTIKDTWCNIIPWDGRNSSPFLVPGIQLDVPISGHHTVCPCLCLCIYFLRGKIFGWIWHTILIHYAHAQWHTCPPICLIKIFQSIKNCKLAKICPSKTTSYTHDIIISNYTLPLMQL